VPSSAIKWPGNRFFAMYGKPWPYQVLARL